jgi:hypothetical protein
MVKPEPIPNVYDWQDLQRWIVHESEDAARELRVCVHGHPGDGGGPFNGSLFCVSIDDHDEGLCGDTLSIETRAFLRAELGGEFMVYVWW